MIVSKRSGFSATELNDAYIFIFLFIYLFCFTFFCPYEYQRMQFTVFIIKIDHLPIASAANNKTSTGKNFIFRTFPCKTPLSCNCKIEISSAGPVLKAQIC